MLFCHAGNFSRKYGKRFMINSHIPDRVSRLRGDCRMDMVIRAM